MTVIKFCAALLLAIPSLFASAAVVNISQTIDLTEHDLASQLIMPVFPGTPFNVAVGDTVNINFDFLGSQTLIMDYPAFVGGTLDANDLDCYMFHTTGSVHFFNPKGPMLQDYASVYASQCSYVGIYFDQYQFITGDGPIEFSGMAFSFTVDSYDLRNTREYKGPSFTAGAWRLSIGTEDVDAGTDVPEPASLPLLGLGLAGLLAARRRKQA